MATLPETHQTYITCFEMKRDAKFWQVYPTRAKVIDGETWFHAPSNEINSRKESYLNEIFSMKEARGLRRVIKKEQLEQSCRGCQLGILQGSNNRVMYFFPMGWATERCQRKWAQECGKRVSGLLLLVREIYVIPDDMYEWNDMNYAWQVNAMIWGSMDSPILGTV